MPIKNTDFLEAMMELYIFNNTEIKTSITANPDKSLPQRYTITFLKPLDDLHFFGLISELIQYLNIAVGKESNNAYIRASLIPPNIIAEEFNGIILEPNIKEGHEKYSAVVNALENILMAADEACRKNMSKEEEK